MSCYNRCSFVCRPIHKAELRYDSIHWKKRAYTNLPTIYLTRRTENPLIVGRSKPPERYNLTPPSPYLSLKAPRNYPSR